MITPVRKQVATVESGKKQVTFGGIKKAGGHRVLLYGPGGIGKTTLACSAPGKVAFLDLDDSLGRLKPEGDITVVDCVNTWNELRAALQSDGWDGIGTIVIDTGTKAEEMAIAHTLDTVPHEKGQKVTSVEGYGFGKGLQYVFDSFLPLLADLDRHARAGRNVILVCHDCVTMAPNPAGEDWQRYEPRLQSPSSGKNSIRLRCREWADHVLFMGYDVDVKDGKGRGSGTRTIYTAELPFCMAKSRTCQQPIPVTDAKSVWGEIIK